MAWCKKIKKHVGVCPSHSCGELCARPAATVSGSNYNPARDGELAVQLDNQRASDAHRACMASEIDGVLQILSTEGCLYLVSLGGSAERLGAAELASRGVNQSGQWVGFEAAHKFWRI